MFGLFDNIEKTHRKLHEQCYYLVLAHCFYEILNSELDRLQISKNQRILKIGIDPEAGRDYAMLGIKIMAMAKNAVDSLADLYVEQLKEEVYSRFRQIYSNSDMKGQADVIWNFAPRFNQWVSKITRINSDQIGELSQAAIIAINQNDAAKIVYRAFEPPTFSKNKGSEETADLIHQCFSSWSSNGWYIPELQTEERIQQEVREIISSTEDRGDYFEKLHSNANVSEELFRMILNIHQTLANFTSLFASSDDSEAGRSIKKSMETPIKTLLSMDDLVCTLASIPIASDQQKIAYMGTYLSKIVNMSDDILTHHMNKSHAWYIENIQNFSPEIVMDFEVKSGNDNNKLLGLILDYMGTPEQALSKITNDRIKDLSTYLNYHRSAIQNFLQMNNIELSPPEYYKNKIEEKDAKISPPVNPGQTFDDGAGFL